MYAVTRAWDSIPQAHVLYLLHWHHQMCEGFVEMQIHICNARHKEFKSLGT